MRDGCFFRTKSRENEGQSYLKWFATLLIRDGPSLFFWDGGFWPVTKKNSYTRKRFPKISHAKERRKKRKKFLQDLPDAETNILLGKIAQPHLKNMIVHPLALRNQSWFDLTLSEQFNKIPEQIFLKKLCYISRCDLQSYFNPRPSHQKSSSSKAFCFYL